MNCGRLKKVCRKCELQEGFKGGLDVAVSPEQKAEILALLAQGFRLQK
jgi:hypothetical protein